MTASLKRGWVAKSSKAVPEALRDRFCTSKARESAQIVHKCGHSHGVRHRTSNRTVLHRIELFDIEVKLYHTLPGIAQQWFLDDGCLRAKFQTLEIALRTLVPALRHIGLEVNAKKCELYAQEQPQANVLANIPVIADRDAWSYLGVPLAAQSSAAFMGVVRRLEALSDGPCTMANGYPRQSLQLLRSTIGACRVEYLLQNLPPSELLSDVVNRCESGLRRGLGATLGGNEVPATVWEQALIPVRLGGPT